ncbi:flavodoxin family protein [Shimia biformata]|uniref:flavodoxin family protein n=1 Tax=Shimia biformata TaxID=1294299 RepID=UPI0023B3258D|nr:flavodoxin family protein [Shimia biformata]
MPSCAIVYFSAAGHTRLMADILGKELAEQGIEVSLLDVETMAPEDWDCLRGVDGMLWGSPTYMGGVAAQFKTFMDESALPWEHRHWADKLAGGFTVAIHPAGDKLATLQQMSILAAQHGMLWVGQEVVGAPVVPENAGLNVNGVWLGLDAVGIDDATLVAEGDRATARAFARRFAAALKRWGANPAIGAGNSPPK